MRFKSCQRPKVSHTITSTSGIVFYTLKGKWLQYFHEKDAHRLLSRTENILPFFPQLHALLNDKVLVPAKAILQDDALVYKDKIIYKLPGSQGR